LFNLQHKDRQPAKIC